MAGPAEVVGVRLPPKAGLSWYRRGEVPAEAGSWVLVEQDDGPAVGQVVVGAGQCLEFPGEVEALPSLLRAARGEESPSGPAGAGKRLWESLGFSEPIVSQQSYRNDNATG